MKRCYRCGEEFDFFDTMHVLKNDKLCYNCFKEMKDKLTKEISDKIWERANSKAK